MHLEEKLANNARAHLLVWRLCPSVYQAEGTRFSLDLFSGAWNPLCLGKGESQLRPRGSEPPEAGTGNSIDQDGLLLNDQL